MVKVYKEVKVNLKELVAHCPELWGSVYDRDKEIILPLGGWISLPEVHCLGAKDLYWGGAFVCPARVGCFVRDGSFEFVIAVPYYDIRDVGYEHYYVPVCVVRDKVTFL